MSKTESVAGFSYEARFVLTNTAQYEVVERYGAAEDRWPPPTPPSPAVLDLEREDGAKINKLEHNHALSEIHHLASYDYELFWEEKKGFADNE